MTTEEVSISVGEAKAVSGVLCVPEGFQAGETASVIVAHGAGNDREHPLIVTMSQGLAEAGFLTLRFNFLYREKGRRAPDPQDTLVRTWQAVYQFLKGHPVYGADKIVAVGKSMGGRVASQMVADGLLSVTRLIFLGYPLHPPGKKERMRDGHLYHTKTPMLFFVGTRDPLCDLAQLRKVLARLGGPSHLEAIEGGDHSFRVRKSADTTQQEVYDRILHKTVDWLGKYDQ
ncbi:MAG: alpha/beta fold hydrolase [Deltaproteobacteria bacterium]|nr:alpha/beta fold hydrolase [Deltaproteobacteria bacterium]MBW2171122.1 alpha/beta fold hydrolase [Deltaproteobacteria bacterium]MBW2260253.1 alpha/beta fold hydrolase [Deltaproteobacteria bacterium]